ncbi:MAG: acetyl-CoA C-acetyltransferase [Streptosporangiaceae bacterium]
MTEAWLIDACRTPRGIGKPGKGALTEIHPQHVSATVLRAIAERNDLDTADVDDVIWGTSGQVGTQGGDLGRMAALDAGYDITSSGVTIDRFCGSSLTAGNLAAGMIMSRLEDVVVAGGCEMMSAAGKNRAVTAFTVMDRGNLHLRRLHPQTQQGIAADTIATLEKIDRETVDTLAAESQRRAAIAVSEGRFDRSLVPVFHPDGTLALDHDEYPRPGTTTETLSGLRPSFAGLADQPVDESGTTFGDLVRMRYPDLDIEHVHHAGNSSGVVDGAAALLFASPGYAQAHGLTPRARVRAIANMGDDPTLMLNAPGPAARKVLAKAGLTVDDIDLFEVNEAFAVVPEKFIRDLGIDRDKINVNGGAIALGHPIGATGSMLIGTALDELERTGGRYALITMCAGGGMAPAMVIERM